MTEKLINITAPQYRCPAGDCPAVHRSEDGKTFTIVGREPHPLPADLEGKVSVTEGVVEIPADLLLASLGLPALIGAWEPILDRLEDEEARFDLDDEDKVGVSYRDLDDLRSALKSIKGGDNG